MQRSRNAFVALWLGATALKCALAARLPLFVDEAFYWQEGRHLALAYSDLPGLTAWLARVGTEIGGQHALALRWPFLLIGALLPWCVYKIAAREFGETRGWQAASLAALLPLAGTLGVLALPDVPMALAGLLCLDAGARLLRGVTAKATLLLALGLAIGALSHYRFIAVIGVGAVALLCLPEGRRALRDVRVWVALTIGVLAWWPLIAWNVGNADVGLRFQLIDRHPWALHGDGAWFVAIQTLLATPLAFAAMALAGWRGLRDSAPAKRYLAICGSGLVLGFFALGFFADNERVSFHWPLPGYLALLPLAASTLAAWPRGWRLATWALLGIGLACGLGYYAAASMPSLRAQAAATKWYPSNFAGWDDIADAARAKLRSMPAGTALVADNFKLGAELGFALDDADIPVLDHPLNHHHGRAPQLRLWNLQYETPKGAKRPPTLLAVAASEVPYKRLLERYHALCRQVGPLPAATVVQTDHGAQRFLLFELPSQPVPANAPCAAPAMAWIDAPVSGGKTSERFEVAGWAFKDGVGLARVEVLLDGKTVSQAEYGLANPGVAKFWKISNDPQHPNVGFKAQVDASTLGPGRHWLGLRLHGRDGSVETWREQPIDIAH